MAKVIERTFQGDDVTDSPSAFEAAERVAGRRLDRRHSYAIIKGQVCTSVRWTQRCSGCSDGDPYGASERGGGCHECGYTGKIRHGQWIPIDNNVPR